MEVPRKAFTIRRNEKQEKYQKQRNSECLEWVERVLEEKFHSADLWKCLSDGVALCKLITVLVPEKMLIPRFNPPTSSRFKLMENIQFFLDACKSLGFSDGELFLSDELLDGKNIPRVVDVIYRLSEIADSNGFGIRWKTHEITEKPDSSKIALETIRLRELNRRSTNSSNRVLDSVTRYRSLSSGDKDGNSPLHFAVKHGDSSTTSYFIREEPGINSQNKQGQTPLHVGASLDHQDLVKQLLDSGAEPNIRDIRGRAPIHYAAERGFHKIVTLIAEAGGQLDPIDDQGATPLHLSIAAENKYTTLRLIKKLNKSSLRLKDKKGRTPLYSAAYYGSYETCKYLLERDASIINEPEVDGWAPLHAAADRGHFKIVELFVIDFNADKDAICAQGTTPLYHAVFAGHVTVVKFLVQQGSGVNAGRTNDWLPIHASCARSFQNMAKILIEAKANVNAIVRKSKNYAPLHIAVSQKHPNTFLISYLIESGAQVNSQTDNGSTPLHLAVHLNHIDVVRILVAHKAELWCKNTKGRTPLDNAARYGFAPIVRFLALSMGVHTPKISNRKEQKFVEAVTPCPAPSPDLLTNYNKKY